MQTGITRPSASSTGAHRWLPRTIGRRVVGLATLGLAGITILVGFDLWAKTAREVETSETLRLEGVAAALAQTLDGDLHESWSEAFPSLDAIESWSETPPALQTARNILRDTQRAARISTPIYTLRIRDEYLARVRADPFVELADAMEFLLTSANEPYWRHTYEYRPEMARTLFFGEVGSSNSYVDDHGHWLSAYAPIRNEKGETVGLVEVDAPMDSRLVGAKHRISGHVAGLLACFFGSLLLVVALHNDMRRRELETEKLVMVATRTENGVLVTDANGMIEWTNDGFHRLSGWNSCDAEGHRLETRLQSSACPEDFGKVQAIFNSGAPATCQIRSGRRSGETIWSSLDMQPIRNSHGRLTHWVIVQSDISQQKKTEQLMESARDQAIENTRLQSEFLANVSHELRTPLASVLGMSTLLADSRLDEEQTDFVKTIGSAGQRLLDQITELMEYAQLRAGIAEVDSNEIGTGALIDKLEGGFQERAAESGIGFHTRIAEDVPNMFFGDASRVEHALELLLSNAFKFTEEGTVRVDVTRKADRIHFGITDTGIGIGEEHLAEVFESFRQADGSTTRRFGGKGLGLAMARRLVEVMQGEIGVESVEGSGSTFWFALPIGQFESESDEHNAPDSQGVVEEGRLAA